jgi:hypothetical protein
MEGKNTEEVGIQREGETTENRREYREKAGIQRKAGIEGKARIQREWGNAGGIQE